MSSTRNTQQWGVLAEIQLEKLFIVSQICIDVFKETRNTDIWRKRVTVVAFIMDKTPCLNKLDMKIQEKCKLLCDMFVR